MTATALQTAATTIAESDDPAALARILDPTIALAVWRRDLPASVREAANAIRETDFAYSTIIHPFEEAETSRLRADLTSKAGASVLPIADDLMSLAGLFAEVRDASPVRVRLETVRDDGCRLFHFDDVAMRLVVTYAGAGTQWAPPEHASAAYIQQTDYAGPLNNIRTGDVALFRGRRSHIAGVTLHRSPPRQEGDRPRLVAVVDDAGA
ncbi:MAG: DUF1826 domain-containing protein [Pseudomonadota bacterium]